MDDRAYVDLLQRTLPRLGLRYRGFSNVRRQVCRRIAARVATLGLGSPRAYEELLARDPDELRVLDSLCFVTISRFYRDRATWDALRRTLLPALVDDACARGDNVFRAWSLGCASGEEPYTLAIVWHSEQARRAPSLSFEIVATDRDEDVLARAARGVYGASSLCEVPAAWHEVAFEAVATSSHDAGSDDPGTCFRVRDEMRAGVRFERSDARAKLPDAPLHLVLCRNMAFTYWAESQQRALCAAVVERLVPGGFLVLGKGETLPSDPAALGLARGPESPDVHRSTRVPVTSR